VGRQHHQHAGPCLLSGALRNSRGESQPSAESLPRAPLQSRAPCLSGASRALLRCHDHSIHESYGRVTRGDLKPLVTVECAEDEDHRTKTTVEVSRGSAPTVCDWCGSRESGYDSTVYVTGGGARGAEGRAQSGCGRGSISRHIRHSSVRRSPVSPSGALRVRWHPRRHSARRGGRREECWRRGPLRGTGTRGGAPGAPAGGRVVVGAAVCALLGSWLSRRTTVDG